MSMTECVSCGRRWGSVGFGVLLTLCLCLSVSACRTDSGGSTAAPPVARPSQRVDAVQLMTPPTAMNWDDRPGPDGVPVTVYLFRLDDPQPVTLRSGNLDFLMFEGRVGREALSTEPFQTWSFTAEELRSALSRTMVGHCYQIPLAWTVKPPRTNNITLVARYRPVSGDPVYSAPTAISVRAE